jgi:hypothetical protein
MWHDGSTKTSTFWMAERSMMNGVAMVVEGKSQGGTRVFLSSAQIHPDVPDPVYPGP